MAREAGIPIMTNCMVLGLTNDRQVTFVSPELGYVTASADAVILAMGCRERTRGALNIPGTRPAGVYTAGCAQRYINIEGFMPGNRVVILGSGDIGLIMARRLTLEGAKVKVVAELMPYSGGLKRNIFQCLNDYGIPLKLSHTVTEIRGKDRVEGVTISQVGPDMKPIPGTEEYYECDTLLLSVGLIPENELSTGLGTEMSRVTSGPVVNESLETSIPGVFACGNVLHVHDLVDYVSEEAAQAGRNAVKYAKDQWSTEGKAIPVTTAGGVRYTVPCTINPENADEKIVIRFRVADVYKSKYTSVYAGEKRLIHRKKPVYAPGEMETVMINRADLMDGDINEIKVTLEDN